MAQVALKGTVMSGKKGRPPKKTATRQKNIGFYMTLAQYAVIERRAEAAGVNISDYMRQVAIQGEVRAKWTAEEREMVKRLIGMSVDLQGLVTAAGEQGVALAAELFMKYRGDLDEVIKILCHDR